MSDHAPTRGKGGDGNEEHLLVGNALAALLLAVHGAAGAAVVVHLRRRRRRLSHYSSSLCKLYRVFCSHYSISEHNEEVFFPSSLKFASDEIRTQNLLGARRYRAGLAISTAQLALYSTQINRGMEGDE